MNQSIAPVVPDISLGLGAFNICTDALGAAPALIGDTYIRARGRFSGLCASTVLQCRSGESTKKVRTRPAWARLRIILSRCHL